LVAFRRQEWEFVLVKKKRKKQGKGTLWVVPHDTYRGDGEKKKGK